MVAADRRRALPDGSVVDDESQKIFPLKHEAVIYGLAGIVHLVRNDGDGLAFDLVSEMQKACDGVAPSDPFSLRKYVRLACAAVNARFEAARNGGIVTAYPEGDEPIQPGAGRIFAHTLFAGYYKGEPSFVRAHFWQRDQKLIEPEVSHVPLTLGLLQGYGSRVILQKFWDMHPLVSEYLLPVEPGAMRVADAVQLVKNYFRACADPEIRRLDEKKCNFTGESINIATITKSRGVSWIPG